MKFFTKSHNNVNFERGVSFVTPVCPNCERDLCQHGKLVHAEFDEFKEGLGVMFTCGHFNFCSSTVTKDIGDNNMCVQDGLYLKDVHVSWDIDGDRLYYNCQPGEFYSIN